MHNRILLAGVVFSLFTPVSQGQQNLLPETVRPLVDNNPPAPESKRILGIVPNYRTSPTLLNYEPLTTRDKFKVAADDAFDRGTVGLAAMFAGESQLSNSNRNFGQGTVGFGKYLGTAYTDFAIGDYMTEAIFPSVLHQDPRYFRRGTGSGWGRFGYSVGQILLTHSDTGRTQFNYSEVLGNSVAVAISQSYYSNNRTVSDAASELTLQLAVDAAANVLKEFWPDLERKFSRKHRGPNGASGIN